MKMKMKSSAVKMKKAAMKLKVDTKKRNTIAPMTRKEANTLRFPKAGQNKMKMRLKALAEKRSKIGPKKK
jgi:hypothetical protein